MTTLISEFIANTFNSYYYFYELEELECDYDSIYTEDSEHEDDLGDFEHQLYYGITHHYTKDDSKNLICIERHYGIDSEYEFTLFGYEYYKQLILNYINSKMEEYHIKIKNQMIMDAYNQSVEERVEVYKRLTDS